jgi:hypothetical protein
VRRQPCGQCGSACGPVAGPMEVQQNLCCEDVETVLSKNLLKKMIEENYKDHKEGTKKCSMQVTADECLNQVH